MAPRIADPIGHPQLEAGHREVSRHADALVEALARGDRAALPALLGFLRSTLAEQFAAEARLMRDSAFPGARVHEAAHARFAREYEDLVRLVELAGPTPAVALRARTFLDGWVERHVGAADAALATHLRGAARAEG